MLFTEKQVLLKNGETATFRSPDLPDAEKMLNYIKTACGETEFLLRYSEEWDDTTVEQEENWVKAMRSSPNSLVITCFVQGKAVGNCDIAFHSGLKTAHRATIGIAILRDYWNMGIGSFMFEAMIQAAREHGTEIVELEFLEGNDRARHLYEKFGFRVVAEKPNAFKLRDGSYLSEFHMQKYL